MWACFHKAGVRNSRKQSTNERACGRKRGVAFLAFMSRSSTWMSEHTHSGKERLFQLHQFAKTDVQLRQGFVERRHHFRPYVTKHNRFGTGVACHPTPSATWRHFLS